MRYDLHGSLLEEFGVSRSCAERAVFDALFVHLSHLIHSSHVFHFFSKKIIYILIFFSFLTFPFLSSYVFVVFVFVVHFRFLFICLWIFSLFSFFVFFYHWGNAHVPTDEFGLCGRGQRHRFQR